MPLNPIDGYLKTATGFQATVFATQVIVQIRHVELNFYYIMKVARLQWTLQSLVLFSFLSTFLFFYLIR